MSDFIKIIEAWAKFFCLDKNTFLILTTLILGLVGFLIKYLPKWLKYLRNKKLEKDLHPFFTFFEIKKSTQYFIKTRFQNIAPSREAEYRKNIGKTATESLIPFFLKKGFKMGQDSDRFYLVLADSGMGKTTFMINLFISYQKQWRKDYDIKLLPIGHPRFDEKLAAIDASTHGKTILLLDAFDEDQEAAKNYQKRLKEIIEKTQDFREVVITCRTQFFPDEDAVDIETHVPRGLGGNYTLRCFYVSPLSQKEIKQYLHKKFGIFRRSKRKKALEIAYKVPYLMVRPMLLSKIEELLEEKKDYEYAGDIYQTMIDKWIDREADKHKDDTALYKEQLLAFTQAIALDIYDKRRERNGLLLSPEEIQAIAEEKEIILDLIDMQSRSLLNRNAEGKYKFSHKSILEYLVAQSYIKNPESLVIEDFEGMDMLKFFLEEEIKKNYESIKLFSFSRDNNDYNELIQKYKSVIVTLDMAYGKSKGKKTYNFKPDIIIFILSFLKSLFQLKAISLVNAKNQDISILKKFKDLQTLDLRENQIQDISFLKDLRNLQRLYLSYNKIQDISFLKDLQNLQTLNLRENQIQDISFLKDLRNLQELDLRKNQIQDISFLKDLRNLQRLNLWENQIQDISFLKDLQNLQSLDLEKNQIQDISFLKDLKNLQTLDLRDNPVSKEALKDLQKSLPNCEIRYY